MGKKREAADAALRLPFDDWSEAEQHPVKSAEFPCGFFLHLLLVRITNLLAQYGQRLHRTVPRPLSVLLEQYNKKQILIATKN